MSSSSFESCGIRQPKPETKEALLQRARQLAKLAAEMSGGADSGAKEYYYGASNLNPEITPFTPAPSVASSTSSSPAHGTQSQASPSTPKSTLNPESKAFVPLKITTLNVGAAPFIPPTQVVSPPQADVGTVATQMDTLSISKDDLVGMATSILREANEDPSLYDPCMKDFLHTLKEGKVSDEDLGAVIDEILQQGVSSPTTCYVAARMCGSITDELEGFRRTLLNRLQKMVIEALKRPAGEVTLTARFMAEIFTRVTLELGQHIKVLKGVLMEFLEKLFGSNASDTTVQTGCNILKLTGGILESMEASEAAPAITMDQIFKCLDDLVRRDSISSSTQSLVTRVIQLRRGRWGHQSPKHEVPAAKLVMSTAEDGFVYFRTVSSDAPATATKSSGLGVDWSEYVDDGGTPYCDETQSASSGLEDQFDIDAEFEQFQEEEYWHYVEPSYTEGEWEGGPGGEWEETPHQ